MERNPRLALDRSFILLASTDAWPESQAAWREKVRVVTQAAIAAQYNLIQVPDGGLYQQVKTKAERRVGAAPRSSAEAPAARSPSAAAWWLWLACYSSQFDREAWGLRLFQEAVALDPSLPEKHPQAMLVARALLHGGAGTVAFNESRPREVPRQLQVLRDASADGNALHDGGPLWRAATAAR